VKSKMILERPRNLKKYEDGQMRGVVNKRMIPITWDLWTYATLAHIMETREPGEDLSIQHSVLEEFKEMSNGKKPHYKELLDVLIERYPIFETYRILTEEVK